MNMPASLVQTARIVTTGPLSCSEWCEPSPPQPADDRADFIDPLFT
jgi:hypothetical protein